jgi:dTDP-4-dehydrorhamnose reductase
MELPMILLLGGSGFIGTTFRNRMERDGVSYSSVRRAYCNYYDRNELDALIQEFRPDFLINAAGYTGVPNVDACELNKTECVNANVVLPGIIRDVCERRRLPWGHVSSGCIYTGQSPRRAGFRECDPPNFTFRHNNCSFYSGCKALAEEILQGTENCYVWRLRMPFSHVDSARNYLSKLMRYERLLDAQNSLARVDEFVDACLQCWKNGIEFGVYNLTNTGSTTTREVVSLILRSGLCNRQFSFFDSEAEFMRTAVIAPRCSCVLDNAKARRVGIRLSHVLDAIQESLENWSGDRQTSEQFPSLRVDIDQMSSE